MNLEVTSIQLVAFPSCVNPSVNNRKLLSYFPAMYILFCCSTLLLCSTLFYIAHTFSIYCSAIQSAIELQICTVCYALNGQIFLQKWLTQWLRWGVLTQFETIRGCLIIIWTGLNIKIGIIQKVYEWSSCPFAKMIPRLENHFGKIPAWSLIYFLNYAYFDI